MTKSMSPNLRMSGAVGVAASERLKVVLRLAFAAPDSAYQPLTADDVIRRNAPGVAAPREGAPD
jgi:hypothetical protein